MANGIDSRRRLPDFRADNFHQVEIDEMLCRPKFRDGKLPHFLIRAEEVVDRSGRQRAFRLFDQFFNGLADPGLAYCALVAEETGKSPWEASF